MTIHDIIWMYTQQRETSTKTYSLTFTQALKNWNLEFTQAIQAESKDTANDEQERFVYAMNFVFGQQDVFRFSRSKQFEIATKYPFGYLLTIMHHPARGPTHVNRMTRIRIQKRLETAKHKISRKALRYAIKSLTLHREKQVAVKIMRALNMIHKKKAVFDA